MNQENLKLLENPSDFKIRSLSFDNSGQFLTVGGSSLLVYNAKTYENFVNWKSHTDIITSAK